VGKVRIVVANAGIAATATLNETRSAEQLLAALPIESRVQRWGDEVYFAVALELPEEDPQAHVADGTVGYWPPGPALCIFFGQQPVSPVNVVGAVDGDAAAFARASVGQAIRVELAE
jgi:hypothetical protein